MSKVCALVGLCAYSPDASFVASTICAIYTSTRAEPIARRVRRARSTAREWSAESQSHSPAIAGEGGVRDPSSQH